MAKGLQKKSGGDGRRSKNREKKGRGGKAAPDVVGGGGIAVTIKRRRGNEVGGGERCRQAGKRSAGSVASRRALQVRYGRYVLTTTIEILDNAVSPGTPVRTKAAR